MLLCADPKNSKNSVDAVVPPILPGRRSPSRFALPGLGHTCVLCRSFWVPLPRCTGGVDALCSAHGKKESKVSFTPRARRSQGRSQPQSSAALASQNNRLLNLIGPRPPQPRDQSLHRSNKRRYFQYAVRSRTIRSNITVATVITVVSPDR